MRQLRRPLSSLRSFRIWDAHGNKCGPLQAITAKGYDASDDSSARQLIKQHSPQEAELAFEPSERIVVVDHLASAFDLAHSPELLAQELVRAIQVCHCLPEVQLTRVPYLKGRITLLVSS